MMPVCNFKTLFGRCNHAALVNVGKVILPGEKDGFGKDWEQQQYLCEKHANKLLKLLGFLNYSHSKSEQGGGND